MLKRMVMPIFIISLLITNLSLFPISTFAIDVKTLFKNTNKSVVLIMSFDSNNQPIGIGSGFFVGNGKAIATNFHVLQGASSLRIKSSDGQVETVNRLLGIDVEHDLVVLHHSSGGGTTQISGKNTRYWRRYYCYRKSEGFRG